MKQTLNEWSVLWRILPSEEKKRFVDSGSKEPDFKEDAAAVRNVFRVIPAEWSALFRLSVEDGTQWHDAIERGDIEKLDCLQAVYEVKLSEVPTIKNIRPRETFLPMVR
ncbi:MAG: hypothetical protein PSN37_04055 [Alphaproteobacteria bacterium]|nr:hypothetical protein [Alphaproteobacteria bacterium]